MILEVKFRKFRKFILEMKFKDAYDNVKREIAIMKKL